MTHRLATEPQAWADLTIFRGEFNLDDLVGSVIDSWGPTTARVSLWAGSLLVFPIDEKVISIEACLLIGLPLMVPASWTHQSDLEDLLALDQQFGIDIAGIHNMLFWQQVFVLEGFMDERRSRIIGNRGRGGFHVRDQMRLVLFTGFRQMDFVG
jgi:hypothetical protein